MMTGPVRTAQAEGRIRPLDPFRDLEAVVDLIGVAFGDRLDPAGEATLARMRRFARGGQLLQWLWALAGNATVAPGLVWVADGRVVGNLSMRRTRGPGGYLIGNVVVHPSRRRQGIASALVKRAIKTISGRGAHWVGLEVRSDNEAARGLYDGLGFREVGRTRHLLRAEGSAGVGRPGPSGQVRRGRRRDGQALVRLMKMVIPEQQRPLLEVQEADYYPGCTRRVEHWLRCEDEVWYVVAGGDQAGEGEVKGAVRAMRKRGAYPNRMELLVRPSARGLCEADLVLRGLATLGRSSSKRVEAFLPQGADSFVAVLEEEGFKELRVLIQMKRSLRLPIPAPRESL